MKKILLIVLTLILTTNVSYAADNCNKFNNLLEREKYKECLAQNPNYKESNSLIKKLVPANVKDTTKKMLGKMNTDSKLTDYIKKKMSK